MIVEGTCGARTHTLSQALARSLRAHTDATKEAEVIVLAAKACRYRNGE